MKKILLLLSLVISYAVSLHAEALQRPVYVIPVETEIDNSAFHHFRAALDEAREKDAALVFRQIAVSIYFRVLSSSRKEIGRAHV